ncbi:putative nucleotidyltransferase substrate binding domain-containing protein [Derxia lacustris]|uniref:putative nucleotidyltransferase substrate binding domain-containing protein n=1 Tax=Derxia lacustris TaxID=764842 RepID=UPI00111C926F|nr:putative nucleotidyltransferase substrate binding domain-containing protein [Derxia lacustris]
MPNAFNFSVSPFDCLSGDERRLVRDSLDIAYFREGEVILEPGVQPAHLFIVIKGFVNQTDGEELVATYGADDCFDGRALMAGKVGSRFVASEEVLAYQLARAAVTELISRNATFGALLFADLSKKLSALSERHSQHEMQSLTTARVSELLLRPARYIDAEADIVSVVRFFERHRTANVLVRDERHNPPRIGIFTNTGLQRAILDGRPLDQLAVRELANFKLVTARPSDYLFDVLATMIRHRVRRVVVQDGDEITGILEQLDLMSYLSNHSTLITRQINEAADLAALKAPAEHITRLIALLFRVGTKVSLIAKLVQELNAKLFERSWQLIAPPDLVENSCLFVMGSEGRGEQLLKTDQDNGLILRDGYDCPHDLPALCQQLSEALAQFGYPECPGRIMVSNADWRMSATEFGQTVRRWLLMPTAETLMALAIFLDAHAVCGDPQLLEEVRAEVFKLVNDNDALIARFASAINAFAESSGWWNRLFSLGDSSAEQLDLKKAGTFPLVHGIRALALDARLVETGTVDRIEALVAAGKLDAELGTDLVDSLHFFMGLKLKMGLAALEQGRASAGGIVVDKLSSLDRDLLKDTLGVVKRFRALLSHRFRLDAL